MYVVVIGGGNVGYYLTKELLAAGHEVVMIEKDAAPRPTDRRRAGQHRGAERRLRGALPGGGRDGPRGRHGRRHRRRRGQPGRLPGGQDEVQRAARHRPRQQPKNESLFRQLAIDETVSPTRGILGVIEHEIPIHDLLHLADLDRGELQIVEAQLDASSPVVGRVAARPRSCRRRATWWRWCAASTRCRRAPETSW